MNGPTEQEQKLFIEYVETFVDTGRTDSMTDEEEWNLMLGFFVGKGMDVVDAVAFIIRIELMSELVDE